MSGPVEVEAQPFIDGIVYGEGPRWHDGRLWFTDGFAGKVYSVGEAGDVTVEAEVAKASGLGWLPDQTLVVSTLMDARIHHVDASGKVTATFDYTDIAWSTNDLLVTPDGRTYVDLYGTEGAIGLVGDDGAIRVVATGLTRPNCLALLPDGSTLIVGDSNGSRIFAFPVEPDGSLGPPTDFADLGPESSPRRPVCRRGGRGLGRLLRYRRISAGRRGRRRDSPCLYRSRLGGRTRPWRQRRPHAVHGCR